jgi:hypothetical protein
MYNNNNNVNYKNIRILSGYCQTLLKDTEQGISMWRQYKNKKCYSCGMYGHLACQCHNICAKCHNYHTPGICGVEISNKINLIEKNIKRFLQAYDIKTYESEQMRVMANLEKDKKSSVKNQSAKPVRLRKEFKELEKEVKKLEARKEVLQNSITDLNKKKELIKIQNNHLTRNIRADELGAIIKLRDTEIQQLSEKFREYIKKNPERKNEFAKIEKGKIEGLQRKYNQQIAELSRKVQKDNELKLMELAITKDGFNKKNQLPTTSSQVVKNPVLVKENTNLGVGDREIQTIIQGRLKLKMDKSYISQILKELKMIKYSGGSVDRHLLKNVSYYPKVIGAKDAHGAHVIKKNIYNHFNIQTVKCDLKEVDAYIEEFTKKYEKEKETSLRNITEAVYREYNIKKEESEDACSIF